MKMKSVDLSRAGCGPLLAMREAQPKPPKHQVLEHIRAKGAVPRVEIAKALDISPGSVTAFTSELIQAGLLQEVEGRQKETGRGRPRVSLAISREAERVIGIKLSDRTHTAALMDFAGNQIHQASLPSDGREVGTDALIDRIGGLVDGLLAETGLERRDIAAIGIGMPGLIDHDNGMVVWSPLLDSRQVPLAALIKSRLSFHTLIENDTNVLALAELWFGKGRAMQSFALVTIENGIGMAFVLNNRLFRGVRGLGMELGHTKVHLDGALCRCGKRGCLEAYLADYALVREAATALHVQAVDLKNPEATMQILLDEARAGNEAAHSIFLRAGRYLALGLSNIMQVFDPERIIISGERLTFEYFYSKGVLDEALAMTLEASRFRDQVEVHAWEDPIWARGAGALALGYATDKAMEAA